MTLRHWWRYGADSCGLDCRYTGRAARFIAVANLNGPLTGPFFYSINIYIYLGFDHVAQVGLADARMLGGAKYMLLCAVRARRDAAHVDPVGLLERVK